MQYKRNFNKLQHIKKKYIDLTLAYALGHSIFNSSFSADDLINSRKIPKFSKIHGFKKIKLSISVIFLLVWSFNADSNVIGLF